MYTPSDHTFVICAYGESIYLEDCLKSLLAQKTTTSVIITTSTPNAHIETIAAAYDTPVYFNVGDPSISHDWNCAVGHCSTPLVTIAHQDDVYQSDYSTVMLDSLNRSDNPLIFFSNYGEIRNGVKRDESQLLNVKRLLLRRIKRKGSVSERFQKRRIIALGSAICCPSVTYNLPTLPSPLFMNDMKCDLDWQAWERFSNLDGSFVYSNQILMRHRIHEGSETTSLIRDNTRSKEDLAMLQKFWPKPVATLINKAYKLSQLSNNL